MWFRQESPSEYVYGGVHYTHFKIIVPIKPLSLFALLVLVFRENLILKKSRIRNMRMTLKYERFDHTVRIC